MPDEAGGNTVETHAGRVTHEIIRPTTSDDLDGLGKLFAEVFGFERSEDVWRWKYFDNPRGCTSWLCEVHGRVVAHCGGTAVNVADGSVNYMALQSVDFMSSPTHPGGVGRGGVFARTARGFFDAYCGPSLVPMVYGFPGERHRLLGERILGYRAIERVGELLLEPSGSGGSVEPLREEHLPMFERRPARLGAIRDLTFLRWRYLMHPTITYRIVRARGLGGFGGEAAAIVSVTDDRVRVMEFGGERSGRPLGALIRSLATLGRQVVYWCSLHDGLVNTLTSLGFTPAERDHWIECRYFIERNHPEPGEFEFTMGDYDVH